MDFNSQKILKLLCKNKNAHYTINSLAQQFPEISKDHIIEIVHNLYKDNYIKYVTDSSIKITNKGKTYFSTTRFNWLSEHMIETLSLILSLIAIIVSIVALVKSN